MAKSIAKSCPLCLSVNDPADMLPVTMSHSTPPQSAPMFICRLCVLEIMKCAVASDLIDPGEIFGRASDGDTPRAEPDQAPPAAAEADPAVSAAVEHAPEKGQLSPVLMDCDYCHVVHADDELFVWAPPNGDNVRLCNECLEEAEQEL